MKHRAKWIRAAASLASALLIALFTGACGDSGGGRELVSIAVTSNPTKVIYELGGELDLAGIVVSATYDDGATETVANDKLEVSGFDSTTAGEKTITVSYGGKSVTFTVTVTARVLNSITITKKPDKTVYVIGEALDLTGLVVQAAYNDKTTETIANDKLETSGYDAKKAGEQTITVKYGGKSAVFTVSVRASALSGINVKTNPAKTKYYTDEALDITGLVITATYDDGTTEDISDTSKLETSGFDTSTAGEQTVTVTYSGKSASFTVTVTGITSIAVKTNPAKTEYDKGGSLDLTGLVITTTYDDGTTKDLSDTGKFTTSGFAPNTAGKQTVTIKYQGKEANFTVTVYELLNISITNEPAKKNYFVDEALDLTGLVVTPTYNPARTVVIANDKLDISGFDTNTAKEQTITVSYGGKSASFTVTVKARVLESITIKKAPAKTDYLMGEALDLTGLVVEASYDNDTTQDITDTTRLTTSGFDTATAGEQTITVSYGGKSAAFSVTVTAITGIAVKTNPTKTEYDKGEDLDLAGLVVTASYEGGATQDITDPGKLAVSGYDMNAAENQTVTVTYMGKTAAFDITVYELTGITITNNPAKTEYFEGEALNLTGLVVTRIYTPERPAEVIPHESLAASSFDTSTGGSKTITITYLGHTATFDITFYVASITITNYPKTEYFVGETLDLTGLEVTKTYNPTRPAEVISYPNAGLTTSGFYSSSPGRETITVNYAGKSVSFFIDVTAPSGITLNMGTLTITDEGKGLAVFANPISFSRNDLPQTITFNEPGCTVISWHWGNIPLAGNTNTLTLESGAFNTGRNPLSLVFTKDGKYWSASGVLSIY